MRLLARAGLAAALVLAGCRHAPTAVPLAPDDVRPAALLEDLAVRDATRHALRGVAKVSLDGPAGSARSRQILVLARPASLRVEVQGLLNQLVAVLVSNGEQFALYRAEDGSVERGAIHPALLQEVAGLPLSPEDAVQALLGVPPLGEDLVRGPAFALSDGGIRVDLRAATGAGWRVRFDPEGRLRGVEAHGPDGRLDWEARYDDYRPVGGAVFAFDVALRFPRTDASAEVSFHQVELNPELPPGIFALGLAEASTGERG